jgi:hypothetical protein
VTGLNLLDATEPLKNRQQCSIRVFQEEKEWHLIPVLQYKSIFSWLRAWDGK